MDSLTELTQRIPSFPGYAEEDGRRLSDELVRSYLGERLTDLEYRLHLDDPAREDALESLIFRTEFVNQAVFRTYSEACMDDASAAALYACDARVLDLADAAVKIDATSFDGYVADVQAALDKRDDVMKHIRSLEG